jgi:antitoxin YokJ
MIATLIQRARERSDCVVFPPAGQPQLFPPHILPADVHTFYALCGGICFFCGSPYQLTVLPPTEIRLTNDLLLGALSDIQRAACHDDRSWSWYTIGRDDNGDYLSIDGDAVRSGRCYDSVWDRHGIPGDCAVVARSFTELLLFLLDETNPDQPYWVNPVFPSLGDAYE